jgi:hypothetical protein
MPLLCGATHRGPPSLSAAHARVPSSPSPILCNKSLRRPLVPFFPLPHESSSTMAASSELRWPATSTLLRPHQATQRVCTHSLVLVVLTSSSQPTGVVRIQAFPHFGWTTPPREFFIDSPSLVNLPPLSVPWATSVPYWSLRTLLLCRRSQELLHHLGHHRRHPQPPPHRCHTAWVSFRRHDLVRRVHRPPLVLLPLRRLHLVRRAAGAGRATNGTYRTVTTRATRVSRSAGMGQQADSGHGPGRPG